MFRMFRSSLLLLIVAASITQAKAGVVLLDNTSNFTSWDASNISSWSSNSTAYNRLNGHTFLTGNTAYKLDSVSYIMKKNGSGSITTTVRLSVFENASTSAQTPTGGATATYTEDFSGITFGSTYQPFTFAPTAAWNLKANTSYSFWVSVSETTSPNNLYWAGSTGNAAASGSYGFIQKGGFFSTNGGASYTNSSLYSNAYQLMGTALSGSSAVPEPSSMIVFALGAIGMGARVIRSRRSKN